VTLEPRPPRSWALHVVVVFVAAAAPVVLTLKGGARSAMFLWLPVMLFVPFGTLAFWLARSAHTFWLVNAYSVAAGLCLAPVAALFMDPRPAWLEPLLRLLRAFVGPPG